MAHVCVAMDFCDLQYHVQAACQNRFSSKKKKKLLSTDFTPNLSPFHYPVLMLI